MQEVVKAPAQASKACLVGMDSEGSNYANQGNYVVRTNQHDSDMRLQNNYIQEHA